MVPAFGAHSSQSSGASVPLPFARAPYDVDFMHWNGRRTPMVAGQWIVQLNSAQAEPRGMTNDVTFLHSLTLGEKSDLWLVETKPGLQPYQVVRAIGEAQVEFAEPNFAVVSAALPDDPQFDQLWGLANSGQSGGTANADVNAIEAWDLTTGSNDLVIAAFDSGIDYTHPDLADNMWRNPREVPDNGIDDDGNGFVDDVFGIDVVFDDADPMDGDGHGTHTAGTLGAVGNNGVGVAGVAWDVQIMPIKFLSDSGFGSNAKAILGMNYMLMMKRDYGINIVASNHSWSGADYSQVLDDLIAESIDLGITFVAAAGNDSMNNDLSPTYPAAYDHEGLITVAATDANDELAGFSRYGSSTVDLAAPGVGILSTTLSGEYGLSDGTSMSAPYVTGTVALLKSLYPGAGPSQIKSAILNGVDPLPSLAGKTVSGGRLDILGAIEAMGFFVNTSMPAEVSRGETIDEQATEFELELSHAMNSQGVVASDFTVNGIAADSVSVLSSNALRFEFLSSPVSEQGLQEMTLAAGAVSRANDGMPNDTFSATFRYDEQLLQGINRLPIANLVELPWSTLEIQFNEPVDVTSLDTGDLWVSTGSVIDVHAVTGSRIRFTLEEFDSEVERFQFRLHEGSVRDLFGSPLVEDFEGEFVLDFGSIHFPASWNSLEPQSTLAATRDMSGTISYAGDRDEFLVYLNAGQQLSVAAKGAQVSLVDSDGALPDAGFDDSLWDRDWLVAETSRVYRIDVYRDDLTTGDYELKTLLNAVFEPVVGSNGSALTAALVNDYEVIRGNSHQAVFVSDGSNVDVFDVDLDENDLFSLHIQSDFVDGVDVRFKSPTNEWSVAGSNGRHAKTIENFSGPAGRYQVIIESRAPTYTLVTSRNASIDNERNYLSAIAQDVSIDTTIHGFLPSAASSGPAIATASVADSLSSSVLWSPLLAYKARSTGESIQDTLDLVPGEYVIALDAAISFDDALSRLNATGIRVTGKLDLFHAVSVTVGSDVRLTNADWIARVEQDVTVTGRGQISNDPRVGDQWALDSRIGANVGGDYDIGLVEALAQQSDASSVVVAILDTGVDHLHPDLAPNLWHNPGEIVGNGIDDDGNGTIDDDIGFDLLNQDGIPEDDNGHGTHLAGIVGAVSNNAIGVTGVAPGVKVLPVKVLDANRSGTISDVFEGMQYLLRTSLVHQLDLGAVLLSWTTDEPSQILKDVIEVVSSTLDVVVVVPAGNDGQDRSVQPIYPASSALDGMVSVAAVGRDGQLAEFSAFGESISIAAPGKNILSTLPGGEYGYLSGTSAASAYVAGAAALLAALDTDATVHEVESALLSGAHGATQFHPWGADAQLSRGRLNVADSLQQLTSTGDYYRVAVSVDSPLTLVANRTDNGNQFLASELALGFEVFAADGQSLGTAAPGANPGSLEFVLDPTTSGEILVHVYSEQGSGAYELIVDGATTQAELSVTGTTVLGGSERLLVHFDDSVLMPSDITAVFLIAGVSRPFQFVDDDAVAIDLNSEFTPGTYTLAIVPDSIRGFRGGSVEELNLQFTIANRDADFDADGQLGCADLSLLQQAIHAGANQNLLFDLTGDDVLNDADTLEWITSHLGTVPGDANLDGVVDASDWNIWNDHKFTSDRGWCQGDFTGDEVVDASDWNVWHDRRFTGQVIGPSAARSPHAALSDRDDVVIEAFGESSTFEESALDESKRMNREGGTRFPNRVGHDQTARRSAKRRIGVPLPADLVDQLMMMDVHRHGDG